MVFLPRKFKIAVIASETDRAAMKVHDIGLKLVKKRNQIGFEVYVGGGQGWLHQTSDGGFFMATGYAVTKLNPLGYVEWNAACSSCFDKVFNNGQVSGINHDMKPIQGGAVMVGYGSEDWE